MKKISRWFSRILLVAVFLAAVLFVAVATSEGAAHADGEITISIQPIGDTVTYGNGTIVLYCRGNSELGDVTYTWYKQGESEPVQTGRYCTIFRTGESGRYFCRLSVDEYTLDSDVVEAVVLPSVKELSGGFAEYGGEVTLEAEVNTGDDTAFTYEWYKEGEDDPIGTENDLTMTRPQESGLYRCKISGFVNGADWSAWTNQVSVTIYKINLQLAINDVSVTYGDPEQTLTYTRTSTLVGTDTDEDIAACVHLTREEGIAAGTYRITGTAEHDCYAIRITAGNYTIQPKKINVNVLSQSIRYGEEDKALLCQPDGKLAYDDVEEDLGIVLSRPGGSDVGRYPISGRYDNDNYELTFLPATYTILPAEVEVRLLGCDGLVYNGKTPAITCELIAPPKGVDLNPTVTFDKAVKNAGDYVAYIRFDNKNYAPYITEYAFSVAKSPLRIGLKDIVVVQGETVFPAYFYSGFIGKEDESVLTNAPQISFTADRVGYYQVFPYGASAPNYEISYAPGSIQVDYAGVETDQATIVGGFSPEKPVEVAEGGEVKVGLLSLPVYTLSIDGAVDKTYEATVYEVTKYPSIFLRAAIVDEEGNRHEIKSFGYDGEGNLVFSTDYVGTFVLYYDLIPAVVIAFVLIVIVVIVIAVRQKDRRKYRRYRNRQYIARQYADRVVSRREGEE